MDLAETDAYIRHHLKYVGRSDTLIATYAADKAIVGLSATQSAITKISK